MLGDAEKRATYDRVGAAGVRRGSSGPTPEEIFRAAGYCVSSIMFNIVITGVVMLLFTFIAIQTVDHFGRRVLIRHPARRGRCRGNL